MTANKNAKAAPRTGASKDPSEIPERCQSVSPPPLLGSSKAQWRSSLNETEDTAALPKIAKPDCRLLSQRNWSQKSASLRSCAPLACATDFEAHSRRIQARSVSSLDKKLSIFKPDQEEVTSVAPTEEQEQKENQQVVASSKTSTEGLSSGPLSWSTLSLGPASKACPFSFSSVNFTHKRTLSLSRAVAPATSANLRKKISEWECRRVSLPRMSLCLDKRPGSDHLGGGDGLLPSPCSEKNFEFKGARRMSATLSECSYPETEEDEVGLQDREPLGRFQKKQAKPEGTGAFLRSLSARKETSAVLNRIQKIEQALKESPSVPPPQYLSNCYGLEKARQKSFTIGGFDDSDSACGSKRSSICSISTEPELSPAVDRLAKLRQRFSMCSARSESPEPLTGSGSSSSGAPVNPLPKPRRTFEYDANSNRKGTAPTNGLPPTCESPPPLPSTPAPSVARSPKSEGRFRKKSKDRESMESEDAVSVCSSQPSSPTDNGTTLSSRHSSKKPQEENAYEDIVESMKENPYEDVDLKGRILGRNSRRSLNQLWSSHERKRSSPPQLPSKPSSQSLRLPGAGDRKSHRSSRLIKRHSHDDVLLLPPLGVSPSACGLLDDAMSTASDTLVSRRHRRVPKLVRRINAIFSSKRGKKRLKKLSLSNIETASLRDDNSESESDSDDRFKAHTQRLQKLQSILRRAPSYRTLELQLLEWQERELFEYFVVVSLKKKATKNSYTPEVTYQFPKLERPTKQMREAEQRLKAIPQFCFPDARDWIPVAEYSSETFSFMLTGEDGSRRFGYCRRLLPSGKGPRLPEVYCVISRLGCFDLFSKILDEVERRRGISAALVYPFMRSLMESPFPAPGKTIKVKTFLPGAGNEVIELRRPMDSRLEHVDFDSLFGCLSVRQVVQVFASLLLERRVIFVADKLSTLSSCVHAVVALLYPFSWQHTFIPVLPSAMVDIVCCPTPFLVGLLTSSLPKLKDLPVEEALMVDLGTDRFIKQMDDEASLLPRKLQSALEQALEQRNDIINQDSDSESDEECNSLNSLVSESFLRFFLETIGHYSLFMTHGERGDRVFQREAFRKSVASKSIRRFLGVFMESQMFAGFIQDRELRKCRAKGLFEQRVEQYLEELPDTEQSGVNKFLKGLGNKMKFLHKKN